MELLKTNDTLGNITRIEYRGQLVLTTAQLAEFYDCNENNIKNNFRNNEDRFHEGMHYFKVTGSELEILRVKNFDLQISPMTRVFYLWTKRGAGRHCKSIGTDRAWDMFELLEDAYFDRKPDHDHPLELLTDFKRGKELAKLAAHAEDPYTKKRLVAKAANLFLGEEFLSGTIEFPKEALTIIFDNIVAKEF